MMDDSVKFDIELNGTDEDQVYVAGGTVKGNVVLELSKEEKINTVTITIEGEARTYWTSTSGSSSGNSQSTVRTYSGRETLVVPKMLHLLSDGDDESGQVMAVGVHKFPFQFQLPTDPCPSSFQSMRAGDGSIRYWLFATASQLRDNREIRLGTKGRDITVNEMIDINVPQLIEPVTNSNEKTVCCLWCTSGPISLSVTTDRGGYCKGESIGISIQAENHSRRRVTVVRATLKQKVTLYASTTTRDQPNERVEEKLIQRIEGPGIEPGGTCTWDNKSLLIPVTTTPTINSCRIVKLSYYLTVTLALPYATDLHVTIPITIGNMPRN